MRPWRRAGPVLALAAALLALARAAGWAGPPPGAAAADLLVEAGAALGAGEHERAAALAGRVAHDPRPIARQDRAEAWRILGLAEYALGRRDRAESSFYAYLKLDPDAHLDPALVAPEVLSVFEDVRARHAAELAALRPRPQRRRSFWLNFVPLAGQWQNGEHRKMWVMGSAGALLLGANITSYALLRSWCGNSGASATCDDPDGTNSRAESARTMQVVNIASGVGFIALCAYSVVDGLNGYRRWRREESIPRQQPLVPSQPSSVSIDVGLAADRGALLITAEGAF